jgi:hypothetical protein
MVCICVRERLYVCVCMHVSLCVWCVVWCGVRVCGHVHKYVRT